MSLKPIIPPGLYESSPGGGADLPDQTGNNGKFLTTNGTDPSWAAIPGGGDMLASVYDPAGVSAQLAGAAGQAINASSFRSALGLGALATVVAGTSVATALAINIGTAGSMVENGGALGTPSSGTLTNCTGLPPSGLTGLGTGVATALAVNVGSAGAFVVNGGALGQPASGDLTNCDSLPVLTGISGLGSGVAAWLAVPSSANLATAVTDETGSGSLVFGTAPTFATKITVGTVSSTTGSIDLLGTTSGTVTVKPADAAGTWTLTLPTNDGSSGQFLKTDGSGVTSWDTPSGSGSPWILKSSNYTAASRDQILVEPDGMGGPTIQLPSSPSDGDYVLVEEFLTISGAVIDGNGANITSNTGSNPTYTLPAASQAFFVFNTAAGTWFAQVYPSIFAAIPLTNGSTATTQLAADDSTLVATTAFVHDVVDALSFGNVSAAGTLTNNELVIGQGTTAVATTTTGTGILTFLGTPSSANLAAAVTDETGSGELVFATSPTLVTPLLGTPTSGVLTNCTGLPPAGQTTAGRTFSIGFGKDGGGSAISTGVIKAVYTVPYGASIVGYDLSADTGTYTVKFWKVASGTAIPTVSDVINTSGISLSSNTHVRSSTVTDFTTTTITAGDMIMCEVTATSGPTWISVQLEITKS